LISFVPSIVASILQKHYFGKGMQRLKRIYEKANLKVLN
jgi:hypothetical protein